MNQLTRFFCHHGLPGLTKSFSSIQSLTPVRLFATPWTSAHQASLSITNSRRLLNSCPLSWWCHPSISSSVVPFFSRLQSFPALIPSINSTYGVLLVTDKKDQKWGWGSENMSVCKLSHVWLVATLWTVAHQAPLSMGFSRQRILEQVAISSSGASSRPSDQIHVSCFSGIGRKILYHWATNEAWKYELSISNERKIPVLTLHCDVMGQNWAQKLALQLWANIQRLWVPAPSLRKTDK